MLGLTFTRNAPYLRYDAATAGTKRRAGPSKLMSSDDQLKKTDRKQLLSNTRDIAQNYSIAAWAIRKHLDFVSTFSFQAQTESDDLNASLEGLIEWASRPLNFDIRGMHGRQQFVRIAEASRTVDGDIFNVKFGSGHLQGIESDRVRDPDKQEKGQRWIHGVKVTKQGRPQSYAIHKRSGSGYEWERNVPAGNVIPLGYYQRFDQTRGIGLLTSGVNMLRDTYENFDYALAKAKVSQLFALKVTSSAESGFGEHTATTEGDTPEESKYKVDFGKGPIKMEMDPGDDADFLESRTPSTEFMNLNNAMIGVALKSVDIPFSFYDESFTNFFGSRAALIHYLQSAGWKRAGIIEFLNLWTLWRLNLFVATGALVLPAGETVGSILKQCAWIPAGVPWWRPLEEVKADELAVQGTFKSRGDVTMERYGRTYKDTLRILAKEQRDRDEAGITTGESDDEPIKPVEDN